MQNHFLRHSAAMAVESIGVYCRIRPLNDREKASELGGQFCLNANNAHDVTVEADFRTKSFSFNQIFEPNDSQQQVYNQVMAPLVTSFLDGVNCSVIAYGQVSENYH